MILEIRNKQVCLDIKERERETETMVVRWTKEDKYLRSDDVKMWTSFSPTLSL